jgi:heme A synthase
MIDWLPIIHFHIAWTGVYFGLLMFGIGVYIAIFQKRDVTKLFRRTVYVIAGTMIVQALIGTYMYVVVNARPEGEAHWIYGLGTAIALPFFAFIEITAEKRPSMGSYLWGFGMLVAIGFRSILTG